MSFFTPFENWNAYPFYSGLDLLVISSAIKSWWVDLRWQKVHFIKRPYEHKAAQTFTILEGMDQAVQL